MVKTAIVVLAATAATADAGECYCSCCNWCHMSECYDGHSCCDDPSCSGCGHEMEDETPEWVKSARTAAALQAKPPAQEYARGYVRTPLYGNAEVAANVAKITDQMRKVAPDSLDWSNAITGVKNQGPCGSCWAYSAAETIESGLFMKTGHLEKLSEQQIISCDHQDSGCGGGWPGQAFDYVMKAGGIDLQSDYPDMSSKTNRSESCKSFEKKVQVTDWKYAIPRCDDDDCKHQKESDMMAALNTFGPLSVCVNAEGWEKQTSTSGVFTNCGDPTALDHCVQLVGYDRSANYWKVRNSWGGAWGEDGFIRLPMGENACGIANEVTFVTADYVHPHPAGWTLQGTCGPQCDGAVDPLQQPGQAGCVQLGGVYKTDYTQCMRIADREFNKVDCRTSLMQQNNYNEQDVSDCENLVEQSRKMTANVLDTVVGYVHDSPPHPAYCRLWQCSKLTADHDGKPQHIPAQDGNQAWLIAYKIKPLSSLQAEAKVTGECYCSCCNWCHMSECYDGHSCCDDPSCSGCGHEMEDETPEWVKEARAAAAAALAV